MQEPIQIKSALISVFHKDGLENIIPGLIANQVKVYSTGGTYAFLENYEVDLHKVEELTGYPSILGGRVKTLHPKVFGGILAKREEGHLAELSEYAIPTFDLVIVDLYPFEETVKNTNDESAIIEKIDIGGIALIRAAAKNFKDVVVIPSKDQYPTLKNILEQKASSGIEQRKNLAAAAFNISSNYDNHISSYLSQEKKFSVNFAHSTSLRYGENPHQKGIFFGELAPMFRQISGKAVSFNNLVDVDAAIQLMKEFKDNPITCCVLKHTNACGVATRSRMIDAWRDALAGDPTSAFGGVIIFNAEIDLETASAINEIFYEVLIAPSFSEEAIQLLTKKKKRVLLELNRYPSSDKQYKSILDGVIVQDTDAQVEDKSSFENKTFKEATEEELMALAFANKCVKHLKSNTIVLVKNNQLIGMGCGQTSRVDACKQAIEKAEKFGFDTTGSVMASDAFFPFPDCVKLAGEAGVSAIVQPGGSINDQMSIDACNDLNIAMVFTGVRHFKH